MTLTTSSTVRALSSLTAIASLSFLVLGCGGGGAAAGEGAETPKDGAHPLLGKPAPEITAEFIQGDGPKSIKDAKGKVLLLDFWGTFCEPCKKIVPQVPGDGRAGGGKLPDPRCVHRRT